MRLVKGLVPVPVLGRMYHSFYFAYVVALAMGAVSVSDDDKFDCLAFRCSYSCRISFLASHAAGEKGDVVSDLELVTLFTIVLHHSFALGLGCG